MGAPVIRLNWGARSDLANLPPYVSAAILYLIRLLYGFTPQTQALLRALASETDTDIDFDTGATP